MSTSFKTIDGAGVLEFPANTSAGGYHINLNEAGDVSSYTLVFDLYFAADQISSNYGGLFQTDPSNGSDADFFMKMSSPTTFGLGISSQYQGNLATDTWHRITITVDDQGDGNSILTAYADGVQVNQITEETDRFTIDSDNGLIILTDNDGETNPGYLNSFLLVKDVMTPETISELGGATTGGILSQPLDVVSATQFDFDGQDLSPTFGPATMEDRANPVVVEQPVALKNPIQDMMVTPDAENLVIDLSDVFDGSNLTYSVTTSNGDVVSIVSNENGVLELDFDALGHADIIVTATDDQGNEETDWFRARVAGPNAYTFAVLPDTQNYTDNPALIPTFNKMTQWLADNAEAKNLAFVMNVGDMTNHNTPAEWAVAQEAYNILDGVVPYAVVPGNHDQGGGAQDFSSLIGQYFPIEKFSQENGGTLAGVYKEDMTNNYHTFEAPDGTKWLVMSVEFGTRDDVISWAEGVIEDHLDHRVILANHFYMNFPDRGNPLSGPIFQEGTGHNYGIVNSPEGSSDGEEVWRDLLSKYPNVTFTFSGHVFGDGAETLVSYTDYGTPVYQMVANYQNGVDQEITSNGVDGRGGNGGNGAIRLITIDPDNDRVTTETYFVEQDEYLTSSREKEEYDRDGLTGKYREHEETFEDMDIEAPTIYAKAKAGDDQFVEAASGDKTATVTLDGSDSIDPNNEIVSYKWVDEEGRVIAEGKTVSAELEGGRHDLKLITTDVNGVENSDDIRIIVETEDTLLLDNFNDGDFDGWEDRNQVSEDPLDAQIALGLPSDFDAADIPGGDAVVVSFPRSTKNQGYHVELDFTPESGEKFVNYSMVFDILFPNQEGSYGAFFQTDINNSSDADAFFKVGEGIGISGQYEGNFTFDTWHRVAFTFKQIDENTLLMKKFIDGEKVGTQEVNAGRFAIAPDTGFLILTDDAGEIFNGLMNSFLFTGETLSEEKIAELGGVDADGILTAEEAGDHAVQFDFDTGFDATFGNGELGVIDLTTSETRATWKVKGSVASREEGDDADGDLPAAEGALYEYSDGNAVMVWNGEGSGDWSDYVMETTILSQDDDTIGVAVYYQDEDNHYRVTLDVTTNERKLIKVKDGVETVLATEAEGYPFNDEMELKVAVVGDQIFVSLDGHALFNGPVTDLNGALEKGTVALLSAGQYQTIFDDITVNKAITHADAGDDLDVVDFDGDHKAEVTLNAENSFSKDGIVSYTWMLGEEVLGDGKELTVELPTGTHDIKLIVTDAEGVQQEDYVKVNLFNQDQVMLNDGFDGALSGDWKIVDEGEKGDAADWSVADGSLTQSANTYSRELAPNSEDGGVWNKYWSPHGDGWHVLRKGTYALFDKAEAYEWSSYVVETEFTAADAGGVGILFNYQDDKNYYKLELDSDDRFVQLTVLVDGIEQSLMLTRNGFALNETQKLRVEVQDNKIQAYLNGMALFAEVIEDRNIEKGTVGLYSWGTEGVSFDNILVRELQAEPSEEPPVVTDPEATNGADEIVGTDDDDIIDGKGGADHISGGDGDDQLSGGNGSDSVEGNDGDDEVSGGNGSDGLSGNDGDDYVKGGNGSDMLDGGAGDDYLVGGNGSDMLIGGEGDDMLEGGNGSDMLKGGDGDDMLKGGNGADVLDGGAGDDYLHGGNGADIFIFSAGHDEIKGFKSGEDSITIDGYDATQVEYAIEHAEEVDGDLVITFDDDNSLTLLKTDLDDISDDDFVIMM